MVKKILLSPAIILVLICAGLFYVNKVFLPIHLKGMIVQYAEEQLHRQVTLDKLYFNPLKGLVFSGLTVYEAASPSEHFLTVREASAWIMFFPLLQKKFAVSSVRIESPKLHLIRSGREQWNFSDLFAQPTGPGKQSAPLFTLVISGLTITDGQAQVTDLLYSDGFTENIQAINLQGDVALNAEAKLSGSLSLPSTQGNLKVDIHYLFRDGSFKSRLITQNIPVTRYLRFAPRLPLTIREFDIANTDLTLTGSGQNFTISGKGTFPVVDLDPTDDTSLKTALELNNFNLSVGRDSALSLQGEIRATGLSATSGYNRSCSGDFSASVERLTYAKDRIDFAGSLEASDLKLELEQKQSVEGTLRLTAAAFNMQNGSYSASGDLEGKDLSIRKGNNLSFTGDLAVQGFSLDTTGQDMNAKGEIRLSQATFSAAEGQTVSVDTATSHPTITISGANVVSRGDLAVSGLNITTSGLKAGSDIDAPSFSFSLQDGVSELATRLEINKLHAEVNPSMTLTAPAPTTLACKLTYNPAAQQPLSYAGTIDLHGVALAGLETIDKITDMDAHIIFETDKATTKAMTLSIMDAALKVSGEISSFAAPNIKVNISSDNINLALLEKFIPDIVKAQGLKIDGTSTLNAFVDGSLAALSNATIHAQAELRDISVSSSKLGQKIEQGTGLLTYEPPTLFWKDLQFKYQGSNYVLNGYLQDFANPMIAGSFKGAGLTADYEFKKRGDRISIDRLSGSFAGSSFGLTGSAIVAADAQPTFTLTGEGKLALEDLAKILPPQQTKQLEPLRLAGVLKLKADIQGNPADWMNWTSNVIVDTASLHVMGYELGNLRVSAEQKNGLLDPLTVDADLYDGVLRATSSLELQKTGFPFHLTCKLDSTNLAKLKAVTPLKDRRLEGLLTFSANIDGKLTDTASLNGNGDLNIKEGYLFDVPGLSLLGGVLQTSAKTGDLASLRTASATMQFGHSRVSTEDLHIKGPAVDILGQGWIGLDQTMDMTFKTSFLSAAPGSGSAMNVIAAIDPTGELTAVRLYGPINNPKKDFQATNLPKTLPNVIKNTADSILKLFQ
ncbi:MAG: AsmA family protein [Candidatus Omnitrophica bacterium]|nr:AsmA family protein [Candidatus Omnitrophota bacterium]